jgi:hypothetical protein
MYYVQILWLNKKWKHLKKKIGNNVLNFRIVKLQHIMYATCTGVTSGNRLVVAIVDAACPA